MNHVVLGSFTARGAVLLVGEHVLILTAIAVAAMLRSAVGGFSEQIITASFLWRASLIATVVQVCLHYGDSYEPRTLNDRREATMALVQAVGAASLVLSFCYYWLPTLIIGRGVFVFASVFIVVLLVGWRITFNWLSLRVAPVERLLIVGTNAAAVGLARELHERRSELGVELVGFVDNDAARVGERLINPGVIGTISDIPLIARERRVDRVVVSLADARGKLAMDELLAMKLNDGVRFDHLASVYERYTGKIAVENLRPSWFIFSDGFRKGALVSAAKRAIDVIIAAVGLVLSGPVMLFVAIAVRFLDPGPVFYHQRRVGKDGRTFTIHKFRSMRVDAEARTGAVWAQEHDPRVTRIGRFLRRTRLDELPQLWNVLRGDMSFVGPRPERPEFVEELTRQIPFYGQRHVVRPGVTGWAQVRHGYGSSVEDALQKLQYDLFYIKHLSVPFDLVIVVETVKTILVRRGS